MSGIPRNLMTSIDADTARVTSATAGNADGTEKYIPGQDAFAKALRLNSFAQYKLGQDEKKQERRRVYEAAARIDVVPDELKCRQCGEILTDAVAVPCCKVPGWRSPRGLTSARTEPINTCA
jgi:hypothetical protein